MEPLTLALLGYPLSMLANVSLDQAKRIREKISDFSAIERLFIKCFYESISKRDNDKNYDDYSSKVLAQLKKLIKQDEKKFLNIISDNGNIFLSSFNRKEYNIKVAIKITESYSLDLANFPELINGIVTDCFSYYVSSFYKLMNEKEGIQAILLECLKLNQIIDLLHKIDNQVVTKDEFDEIRKIVINSHSKTIPEYKKRIEDYDEYIKNKFKYLELRGFSPKISGKEVQMELDDIFVPLSINKQQSIVPNILEKYPKNNKKSLFKSIEILNNRAIVILGDPGSGKSTLLKYLASQIIELRKSEHILSNIIPVFFKLADYSDYYKAQKKSIYEFITNHFDSQYQHIYKENFEYSNMLFLMDGLDEIAETPLRLKVTEQVMDLIARYPNNRYFVSSRIVGYQESKLGGAFIQFKLLPFRKEEIELFSNKWYESIAAHTDKNYEQARQQATSLYNSITRNPSVLKLATNPLLMTIISMIHYQGKKLPSKRIELYEISTETFLEHWVQLRISDEKQLKDKAEIIEILAPIAFEIHNTKSNALIEEEEFKEKFLMNFQSIHTNTSDVDAKLTCKEFILFLRQQTGFFYEKGVDDDGNRYYGFMHLTFEEYLAAIELVSKWNENEIKLEDYIFQPRWTEIIRLAASQIRLSFKGKAGRTNTSNFINDILNVNDNFKDAYRPLQLVCLIISDDISINDSLLNEIYCKIIKMLSTANSDTLVKSFALLFSELLLSDKHSYFIDGFKENITTENVTLKRNLTRILCHCFEFPEVNSILRENLQDAVIIDEIIKINRSHPFRKTELMNEIFTYYLSKNKIVIHNDGDYWLFRINILGLFGADEFYRNKSKLEIEKINNIIQIIKDFESFETVSKIFSDYILTLFARNRISLNSLNDFLNKISIPHFETLSDSIKGIDTKLIENFRYGKSSSFNLSEGHGVMLENQEGLLVFTWSEDFRKLKINKLTIAEVEEFITSLEGIYSNSDLEIIKYQLYYIEGPVETRNNLENFINSYNQGNSKLYDFFGWEDFIFFEIINEPELISEIIIKNSLRYKNTFDDENLKIKLNANSINKLKIPAPIKLFVAIKTSQPYSKELIDNSIKYYNSCKAELKSGVFEILYSILNISNTTDNNV